MKVLILGATGFIGFPVAQALVRAGHIVYAIVRTADKAQKLAAEEMIPIIADATEIDKWIAYAGTVDVLIEALGGSANVKQLGPQILRAVSQAAQETRPTSGPKLTYIYTSGTWVHGNDRSTIVTDTTPITNPIEQVTWRPAQEQSVINDPILNGIVIRPALLYGRSGSLLGPMFRGASEGLVRCFGSPGGRWALIHCDDLADMYVRAAERAPAIGGIIFDAANDFTESIDDILSNLVKVSGASKEYGYIEPSTVFERALTTTSLLRPYLARSLLGWQPKKPGLADGMVIYYAAWKAYESG